MKTRKNSDSELKSRSAQHRSDTLPKIDFVRRRKNRGLSVESVLNLIRTESPDFWNGVEVVGKWVWLAFADKQPKQITATLAELGFHWNNRRQVWQHPCGMMTNSGNYDPRRRYRSYFPADEKAA